MLLAHYAAERACCRGRAAPERRAGSSQLRADTTFEALILELERQLRMGRAHFDAFELRALDERAQPGFVDRAQRRRESDARLSLSSARRPAQTGRWTYDLALFDESKIVRWTVTAELGADGHQPINPALRELTLPDAVGIVSEPLHRLLMPRRWWI